MNEGNGGSWLFAAVAGEAGEKLGSVIPAVLVVVSDSATDKRTYLIRSPVKHIAKVRPE
jgi:hypothetical protein